MQIHYQTPKNDSRKLLDNVIITKLSFEQQINVRKEMCAMVEQAIFDTEKQTNDEILKSYNKGVCISLKQSLLDLKNQCDMYFLKSKYENIASHLSEIYLDFSDTNETEFSQSMMKGLISGYINISEVLASKLSKEENSVFRQTNLQPLR